MNGICIEFTEDGMMLGMQCNGEEAISAVAHLIKEIADDDDTDQIEVLSLVTAELAEINLAEKVVKNRRSK